MLHFQSPKFVESSLTMFFKKINYSTLAIKVNPKTIWDIAISMAAEVKWFFLLTLLIIKAEIEYPITQALCTKIDNI